MHRRLFLFGLLGIGAAAVAGGPGEAMAAMPVAPPPGPEPIATTAEIKPGRDAAPAVENAQFGYRRRRRRVFIRRRRRVFFRRRRGF